MNQKALENYEQQMFDSDMIFGQMKACNWGNLEQAEQVVCQLYALDLTVSRSGISHALKRLEKLYKKKSEAKERK